jgi:hypothetical protein
MPTWAIIVIIVLAVILISVGVYLLVRKPATPVAPVVVQQPSAPANSTANVGSLLGGLGSLIALF